VRQLDRLARLDEVRRTQNRRRRHVIAGAALVAGAPLRRATLAVGRWAPRLGGDWRGREAECQGEGDCEERAKARM
jgi:hypothetical protein